MKNFLSTACILLIGIVQGVHTLEYNFGDIIRFKGHYGLALGTQNDKGEEAFFHKTDNPDETCRIGHIRPNTNLIHKKDNYQDETTMNINLNEIKKRLEECQRYKSNEDGTPCCGKMDHFDNNCEHTVTYIRYGEKGRVSCLAWYEASRNNIIYLYDKNGNKRSLQRPSQCDKWEAPI